MAVQEEHFHHPAIIFDTEWRFVCTVLQLLRILSASLSRPNQRSSEDSTNGLTPSCFQPPLLSTLPVEACIRESKEEKLKPKRPQDAPPLADTAVSVAQINTVKTSLQFVARLGICPNLNPGVGIPWQHRSKFLASMSDSSVGSGSDGAEESSESKQQKLGFCISVMVSLIDIQELGFLVLNSLLNDILAGLLQLLNVYSATKTDPKQLLQAPSMGTESETGVSKEMSQSCNGRGVMASPQAQILLQQEELAFSRMTLDGDYFRRCLNKILINASPDLVIRELMVLQAGVPQRVQDARKGSSSNEQRTVQPPPPWLRKSCSQILLEILSGSSGIMHLYSAMAVGVEAASPAHWKCCQAVAKVVSRCPVPSSQAQQYVEQVSKQLFEMLHLKEKLHAAQFTKLVGAVTSEMATNHKENLRQFFFTPLLQPLTLCTEGGRSLSNERVLVDEDTLNRCLEDLHQVFVVGQQPQASVLAALQPMIGVVWILFALTRSGVYSIRRYVRELLVKYLKHEGSIGAAELLRHLTIGSTALGGQEDPHMLTKVAVRFVSGGGGGLKALPAGENEITTLSEKDQVEAAIDILGDLKSDGVAGELLVLLLKELTEMISTETKASDIILPARVERSEVREQKADDFKRKVTLLHLLATICETFGSECLSDTRQILLFVKVSLERGVAVCRSTAEEEMAMFETETMSMAMGLLTTVLAGAIQMGEDHRAMLDEMLPLLAVIGEEHPDEFIQEMASDIRIAIATRGAVWSSLQEKKTQGNKNKESPKKPVEQMKVPGHRESPARPLIEELPDILTPVDASSASPEHPQHSAASLATEVSTNSEPHIVHASSLLQKDESLSVQADKQQNTLNPLAHAATGALSTCTNNNEGTENGQFTSRQASRETSETSSLLTVFEELCDPLIPVRGHALMSLTRLVQEKDPETLAKKDTVLKIFQENLHHGDSYLYLAAINGLSGLADRFPDSVIPALAEEFAKFSSEKSAASGDRGQQVSADHRLKLGEVLMKATRNLGETVPRYRDILLWAVMAGARDRDSAVRASSVSNLAELCQLLRFSLGPVLQEVLNCCSSLLTGEDVIVRRAAALTLAKIVDGLDSDIFTVLDSSMRDLYRLLRNVQDRDPDDAVRLHANMALVQLDSVTRGFLFPKQTLQKKIQVLPDADTFR